jgi:hypothetical protein
MDETSWFERLVVTTLVATVIINAIATSFVAYWLW